MKQNEQQYEHVDPPRAQAPNPNLVTDEVNGSVPPANWTKVEADGFKYSLPNRTTAIHARTGYEFTLLPSGRWAAIPLPAPPRH